MDHEHTTPPNPAGAGDHTGIEHRIDEQFADVLRNLDALARRTDRRFAEIEARAAELSAHFGSRAARILGDLPTRPAMPPVPPRPAYPPHAHPAEAAPPFGGPRRPKHRQPA